MADRTEELCRKQHITMYRLAQLAGVKQSTISNIMKKKTLPSLITLEKICTGLNITLSQFFAENNTCCSLTEDQKQLVDIWISLSSENKALINTILQGMINNH